MTREAVARDDAGTGVGARRPRDDGTVTRHMLIEVAGALFAEQGYASTTSKEITERAGTNVAAVNYHFGSREKLYIAVLEEVDRRLIGLEILHDLQATRSTAAQKLGTVIETILGGIAERSGWPVALWAREVTNPTPQFAVMIREGGLPKFDILASLVSQITGITDDDTAVLEGVIASMAPVILLASVNRAIENPIRDLYHVPHRRLAEDFTGFAIAGLRQLGKAHRRASKDGG